MIGRTLLALTILLLGSHLFVREQNDMKLSLVRDNIQLIPIGYGCPVNNEQNNRPRAVANPPGYGGCAPVENRTACGAMRAPLTGRGTDCPNSRTETPANLSRALLRKGDRPGMPASGDEWMSTSLFF